MIHVSKSALKHGLTPLQIIYAWENPIRIRQRSGSADQPIWVSIGPLPDGRFAELVGFVDVNGDWYVFHAMTPPTKKFKRELGLRER